MSEARSTVWGLLVLLAGMALGARIDGAAWPWGLLGLALLMLALTVAASTPGPDDPGQER